MVTFITICVILCILGGIGIAILSILGSIALVLLDIFIGLLPFVLIVVLIVFIFKKIRKRKGR